MQRAGDLSALFELICYRYERKSLLVTSNQQFRPINLMDTGRIEWQGQLRCGGWVLGMVRLVEVELEPGKGACPVLQCQPLGRLPVMRKSTPALQA